MSDDEISQLAKKIANVFFELGWTWKIGGEQKIPVSADIQAVLDRAKFEVEYQAVNSHVKDTRPQIAMKHLLFNQALDGSIQVYVHIGEIE